MVACNVVVCRRTKKSFGGSPRLASEAAAANEAIWSMGLLGDLGGIGGGTLLLEPVGLSHRTAGMFRVSGAAEDVDGFADTSSCPRAGS